MSSYRRSLVLVGINYRLTGSEIKRLLIHDLTDQDNTDKTVERIY